MMLNNKQKCIKIQKQEKKHHEKAAMQALRGPGELARRLEKETRGQPQRFLNKNKNTLNYYLSLFTYSLVTYLHLVTDFNLALNSLKDSASPAYCG